ncbi:hypothetical protein MTP99_003559 [Tenebrio molitor]|nr:hypothetical protein MTP99_003559 [Tenebrio molitor]
MKEMVESLGNYVRKKKLELNVEKTKVMVFDKRKRKSEENEWNWEEISQILGEIMRKANKVMGTGERKWGVISGGE